MTVHPVCRKQFEDFVNGILIRAEMDASVFQLIEETKQDFKYVRKAIDPAMSTQNVNVQALLRELLDCECKLYEESVRQKVKGR
jgi:hypothetical protein